MKKYKLKQTIVVTVTGAQVTAKVIKEGTTIYENRSGFYSLEEKSFINSPIFNKDEVESTPELFELVTENQTT